MSRTNQTDQAMLDQATEAANRIAAQADVDANELSRSGPEYASVADLKREAAGAARAVASQLDGLTGPASSRDHLPDKP